MPIPLGEIVDAADDWASGLFQVPVLDTNPDAMGGSFSSAFVPDLGPGPGDPNWTGFGPGGYSGNYTGEGDRVYWGPYDDVSSTSSHHSNMGPVHVGPGGLIQQAVSSTGDTILMPPSQTTSVAAPASSTGETQLGVGSDQSAVVLPASTIGDTDVTMPIVHEAGSTVTTEASSGAAGDVFSRTGLHPWAANVEAGAIGEVIIDTGDDVISGSGQGGSGSVEMQPLGPDVGVDSTVYDGDSYHGISDDPHPGWSGQDAPGGDLGGDLPMGDVELADLGGDDPSVLLGLGDGSEMEEKANIVDEESGFGESGPSLPGSQPGLLAGDEVIGGDTPMGPYEASSTGTSIYDPAFTESVDSGVPSSVFENGNPLLLDDMPDSSIMSWEMLNLADASPEALSVLSDGFSDASNLSLGSAGIGTSLPGFMKNRAVDLIGGQLLMPIFNWIDDTTDDPWTSRIIQGTLASAGWFLGGDPFGVIAAPICWGIQEYMRQRQRLKENNNPEADRGRKFGYVREGDKWYPAIQTSKERDEGWLGSNKTQVTFQYGDEIQWKKKKGSTEWMPYFEEGTYHMKNFHVWDNEVDKPGAEAGETYQKRVDPLRDFYYLSEDETMDYLRGIAGGDTITNAEEGQKEFTAEEQASIKAAQDSAFGSFAAKDDQGWNDYWNEKYPDEAGTYTKRGAYVDQLQDIRKSLEFMQSYRYSEPGQLDGNDFGVNEFEGSRQFRAAVNDNNYLGLATWNSKRTICNPQAGYCADAGHHYADLSGRLEGSNADELANAGKTGFQDSDEMKYLTDMYVQQRDMLYKTQKAAGSSMGFNDKYGHAVPDYIPTYYTASDGVFSDPGTDGYKAFGTDAFRGLKDNGWALYQDGTWEIGPTTTSEELRDAIAKIEASGQSEYRGTAHYRNEDQRSYLAQKAYCRYLYSKINQLGGYDYFNSVQGPKTTIFDSTTARSMDPDRIKASTAIGMGWALDPMYSEIDDHNRQSGSFGNDIVHRDDYVGTGIFTMGQDGNSLRQLQQAGVIGSGVDNPDYIAGRFTSMDEWAAAGHEGSWDDLPFDVFTHAYVEPNQGGSPGSHYDWKTNKYEMPDDWVDPGDLATLGTFAADDALPDWDVGFGAGQEFAASDYWDVPEGWYVDDYGNLLPTYEKQAELDAAAAEAAAQTAAEEAAAAQQEIDDRAKDEADAAAAAAAQVVPDETHGATHIHDEPIAPEHHEIQHFTADPTAPAHLPMGLITAQIQEGVKVI